MCGPKRCDSPDCTWGEKFRRECLARHVMRLPDEKRREFYQGTAKKHGTDAFLALKAEVNRQWAIQNAQHGAAIAAY